MSSHYLVIEVRLLHRSFHGRADAGRPEWPPSPGRLFQALVAAAGDRRTAVEDRALRWLECQPPPIIDSPPNAEGAPRRTYVPNNDADQHYGEANRMLKVVRATHVTTDCDLPLRYIWEVDHDDNQEAATMTSLASRLGALGWGIDSAIGHGYVTRSMPRLDADATRWLPHPPGTGGQELRAPTVGTLAGLDVDHARARRRIQHGTQTLSDRAAPLTRASYRTTFDLPPRPIRIFKLFRVDGAAYSCWPALARNLTAMLRHAAHEAARRADWDQSIISGYVCGHGNADGPPPEQRLSYLALPSIGHQHADGYIRTVAIAEAPGGDGRLLHQLADRMIGMGLGATDIHRASPAASQTKAA